MLPFGKRRDPVRLFLRRLGLLALLIVLFVSVQAVWSVYNKERESRVLRAQAQSQLADLSARQAQLQEDIAKLKTDRGMEEALRRQYALAKSGEGLIVIVDPAPAPSQATSSVFDWFHKMLPWW